MNFNKQNFKILFTFFQGQFLLQLLNIFNGFFLLRWLSIQEQAKFSVAFSIQSLTLSLSDLGFAGSIIALVGERINDKKIVGGYIAAARSFRKLFFAVSCLIVATLLPFIIQKQHWSYTELAVIIVPVMLAVFWEANFSLYSAPLMIHKEMKNLYLPQVIISSLKLLSNFFLFTIGRISSVSTLFINAFSLLINGKIFKKKAASYVSQSELDIATCKKEMFVYLKPLIPGMVFNAFYGQVQIFLVSFFGKTQNIAEIAALGRLSQVFVFLNAMNGVLIAPYIAKSAYASFWKKYIVVLFIAIGIAGSLYMISRLFPDVLLFLLGPKYMHLQSELSLVVLSACLNYIGGVMWAMHSARKWIFWWGTWSFMFSIIACQIIGIWFLDLSTTRGVLLLSVFTSAVVLLVVYGSTIYLGFRKERRDSKNYFYL